MLSLLVLLTACATEPASVASTPVAAAPVSDSSVPAAAVDSGLSTKTVVPAGYEKFLGVFTPYRITIQQGNCINHLLINIWLNRISTHA